MKYKITYQYTDYDFMYDEELTRTADRYFANYGDYSQFMQDFDMISDENSMIIDEKTCPDIISGFYYALAYIVYICRGYNFKAGKRLFYHFMHRALIYTGNNSLCYKFDNRGQA